MIPARMKTMTWDLFELLPHPWFSLLRSHYELLLISLVNRTQFYALWTAFYLHLHYPYINFINIIILSPSSSWSRSSSSSPAGGNRDASARHGTNPWRGDEGIVQVGKYLIYLEGSFRWKNMSLRAKRFWAVRTIGHIHMFAHCDDNNDKMVREIVWYVKKNW